MQNISVRIVLEAVPHCLGVLGRSRLLGLFFLLDRRCLFCLGGLLFLSCYSSFRNILFFLCFLFDHFGLFFCRSGLCGVLCNNFCVTCHLGLLIGNLFRDFFSNFFGNGLFLLYFYSHRCVLGLNAGGERFAIEGTGQCEHCCQNERHSPFCHIPPPVMLAVYSELPASLRMPGYSCSR